MYVDLLPIMDEIIDVSALFGVPAAAFFVGERLASPLGGTGLELSGCVKDFVICGLLLLLCSYDVQMLSVTDPDELLSVRCA